MDVVGTKACGTLLRALWLGSVSKAHGVLASPRPFFSFWVVRGGDHLRWSAGFTADWENGRCGLSCCRRITPFKGGPLGQIIRGSVSFLAKAPPWGELSPKVTERVSPADPRMETRHRKGGASADAQDPLTRFAGALPKGEPFGLCGSPDPRRGDHWSPGCFMFILPQRNPPGSDNDQSLPPRGATR